MNKPKLKLVVSEPRSFAGVDFKKYQSQIDEAVLGEFLNIVYEFIAFTVPLISSQTVAKYGSFIIHCWQKLYNTEVVCIAILRPFTKNMRIRILACAHSLCGGFGNGWLLLPPDEEGG